jgi:hypothetical protein
MRDGRPRPWFFLLVVCVAGCAAKSGSPRPADGAIDRAASDGAADVVPDAEGRPDPIEAAPEAAADVSTSQAGDGATVPDAASDVASVRDAQVYGPDGAPCWIEGYPVCCGQPGEIMGGNCLPRQSVEQNLAHCLGEGSAFDLKDRSLGVHCCTGLVATPAAISVTRQTCSTPPISLAVCLPCGDGVCQVTEDRCSCPADCH